MKRFMYFSVGVLCLSLAALVGFYMGSRPAHAELSPPVVGMAIDAGGSSVFILSADGDLWSRRIEYLDVIDGYGTFIPSLSVSPPARYVGNFFDKKPLYSQRGAFGTE